MSPRPKLTREVVRIMRDAVAAGESFRSACAKAGITWRTGARWRRRGEARRRVGATGLFVDVANLADRAGGPVRADVSGPPLMHCDRCGDPMWTFHERCSCDWRKD